MAIPKHNEIYREYLSAILDGQQHKHKDVKNSVAQLIKLTDEEKEQMLASGTRPVFDDRVAWARTYLKAAGLINYPMRGVSQITAEGRKALASDLSIDDTYLRQFESFREFVTPKSRKNSRQNDDDHNPNNGLTPEESIEEAFDQINAALGDEILTELLNKPPVFFERVVVALLVKMGYGGDLEDAGKVTPASGDEGIDGIIREDKLGFSNIYIQAKRYAKDQPVGRPAIQGFVGAIANKVGKGLFITTGRFTSDAKLCAEQNHIVLISGEKLASLMIEYGVGVSTIQTYEIKQIDSDFFA